MARYATRLPTRRAAAPRRSYSRAPARRAAPRRSSSGRSGGQTIRIVLQTNEPAVSANPFVTQAPAARRAQF